MYTLKRLVTQTVFNTTVSQNPAVMAPTEWTLQTIAWKHSKHWWHAEKVITTKCS